MLGAVSSDLSRLASQLNLLDNFREDETVVKVSPEEDTGEIDEDTQKYPSLRPYLTSPDLPSYPFSLDSPYYCSLA